MCGWPAAAKENWLLIKGQDEHAARAARPRWAKRRQKAAPPGRRSADTHRQPNGPPTSVEVTNGDKVWFPADGITKGDVFHYYAEVADRLLPFLRDRPMTLERLPDGIGDGNPHFWQKHTRRTTRRGSRGFEFPTERGRTVQYVLVNDKATLLYLVNQGTLTFHPWLSRVDEPDRPGLRALRPGPGSGDVRDAVRQWPKSCAGLDEEGVESVPKTTRQAGLHVLTLWPEEGGGFDEAREWARSLAERVVEALPDLATVEIRKAKRGKPGSTSTRSRTPAGTMPSRRMSSARFPERGVDAARLGRS